MIDLSKIDAVIFDLGGVIYNLDYDLTIKAFKTLGGENFDRLYTQATQSKFLDRFEMGEVSKDEFVTYMLNLLPEVNEGQKVIDAWNIMLLDLPAYRIEFLKEIAEKKPIYLFSNTNEIHFKKVRAHLEERFKNDQILEDVFNQVYLSHIVGKRKPNANAFELVINDHGLSIPNTLFIDDSIQHIEGAQKVGLQTYHLVDEDIINIFDLSKF